MLEVVAVLSGALVAFISMVLWANRGRFKSDTPTDLT
jgi:hypothetical protein